MKVRVKRRDSGEGGLVEIGKQDNENERKRR